MIAIKNEKARTFLRVALPFFVIPAVVVAGAVAFGGTRYVWVTLAVSVLALLLFISGFEKKKTGSRRIVVTCVMAALAIVGRFIPLFKPIAALTAICGIYLGGEAGFLCGALSALVSNFYYGHGPWTPFQMLAWGLIGVFAGLLSRPLKNSRAALCVFGVVTGLFFSLVMDVWTVMWAGAFDFSQYLAAIKTAIPHTVMYVVSNVVYLLILRRPIGEKLDRLKIKYGV